MTATKELKGPIIECVPNFSAGKDRHIVRTIANEIDSASNIKILDVNADPDHNRSVITFVGTPSSIIEGAISGVRAAVRLIDLRKHKGVHPRLGAADVIPLVPIRGVDMSDCVVLARKLARRIWDELEVPTYLYGEAALRKDRRRLEKVRLKGFEQMKTLVKKDRSKRPDFGGPALHPTAGACIVGARPPLIAFNVNLNSRDLKAAKKIAEAVREKNSGLVGLKALGLELKSKRCVQVSMNITRPDVVSPYVAYNKVAEEAMKFGIEVLGSELIGLMPLSSLLDSTRDAIKLESLTENRIIELQI
ncbi:MAG: glutamate formimidoyltransferase [Thermoplasmata archaeon]